MFFRPELGLSKRLAYIIYFYTYWPTFILQTALMIGVIHNIYQEALRPFQPLRRLGNIIFRWVIAISAVIAIGVSLGPTVLSRSHLLDVAAQMQQSVNILTLCMMLFVCFALRPLGITMRSRLFGSGLGAGIIAASYLVQSSWLTTTAAKTLYSPVYLIGAFGSLAAMLVWGTYFYLPEARRKTLLVPTTSPYFFWNSLSEALGDKPGFVAIAGLEPDMFNTEELETFYKAHPTGEVPEARTIMRTVAAAQ
jgi:hypothetical protein